MKILIVSRSFYPLNTPRSFRTTELAKEFIRLGHEVVLCIPESDFDYSEFVKEFPLFIKYYKQKSDRKKFVNIPILDRIIYHYEQWLIDYPSLISMKEVEKITFFSREQDRK